MANQLLTISMITRESLMILENNLTFTKYVSREYDDKFAVSGAKIGNTINIRKPPRYTITSGQGLQLQDAIETSVPLVLTTQAQRSFAFTSADLALSIDDFSKRFVKPAVASMANQIDYDGLQQYINIANFVGVPGVTPTSIDTYLSAGVALDNEATPRDDRSAVLNPQMQATLVSSLKGLFHAAQSLEEQYKSGTMVGGKETVGFKFSMDQNVGVQTIGTCTGTPLMSTTAGQTGSSIATTGWTASTKVLNQGDIIQLAGVHSVNPQSRVSTGFLRNFVVTAAVTSGSGAGAATINISPSIIISGPFQNVDVAPAASAVITVYGGSAGAYSAVQTPQALAFEEQAFTLGCADLFLPGGVDMASRVKSDKLGISLRGVRAYDINTDRLPFRLDCLYGWATLYQEEACRICG